MKQVTFNDVEFTTCTFIPEGDTKRIKGLWIHDSSDEFGNADGVIDCWELPENEEEATDFLLDEFIQTDWEVLDTVRFE